MGLVDPGPEARGPIFPVTKNAEKKVDGREAEERIVDPG